MHPFIDPVVAKEFNHAVRLLREFFAGRGFIEAAVQHRLSILSACEDPFNVATFDYAGEVWPLPQTGQMQLEHELLCNPDVPGFFCVTTSYRQEPEPQEGRHNLIFPMFEFETHGSMGSLLSLESDLLHTLGLRYGYFDSWDLWRYPHGEYSWVAERYGVKELTAEDEIRIQRDFGPLFFLYNFPEYTSPFWNMKREGDVARKIDIIFHGVETIGSAERSTNPDEMRGRFHSISGGAYARQLYAKFTKARVERELEEFLSLNFFPRCGGGIGMNRWIRALKLEGLMPKFL